MHINTPRVINFSDRSDNMERRLGGLHVDDVVQLRAERSVKPLKREIKVEG